MHDRSQSGPLNRIRTAKHLHWYVSLIIAASLLLNSFPTVQPLPVAHANEVPFIPSWLSRPSKDSESAAWADYDSDGDLDLALDNALYENQDGVLSIDPVELPVDGTVTSIAWGDYDNDDDLDLAIGIDGAKNHLYRNNGDGDFESDPVWTNETPMKTTSIAWGDCNGDEYLDLVVGNDREVNQIYLNNEDGNLSLHAAAFQSPVSDRTKSVAWGDMDGDGDLDLAVGNYNEDNQVYLNDGNCTLQPDPNLTFGSGPTLSIASGDYDNDGDLDLATAEWDSENTLYRNDYNENGTLVLDVQLAGTDKTYDVAWGDYDGDGRLDLATANSDGANQIYRYNANNWEVAWSSGETDSSYGIAWGDVDGDGDLDIAVSNHDGADRVYHNERGVLATDRVLLIPSTVRQFVQSSAWGDYDGDGDEDLAIATLGYKEVYRNDGGSLALNPVWRVSNSDDTRSIVWGDYDGDNDLDLAIGNDGAPNQVYTYDHERSEFTPTWSSAEADPTTSIAWGDYDGDEYLDLAVGNDGAVNRIYKYDHEHDEFTLTWSSVEADPTTSIAWGDMDGDNDLDLAAGNEGEPNRVYRNERGDVTEQSAWSAESADPTRSIAWGDIDGDGDLDLAVGNKGEPNRVYRGDGGTLENEPSWSSIETDNTETIALGDYDGDGDLDLAARNRNEATRLYRNDNGALSEQAVWSSDRELGDHHLDWVDVDSDGDLDLVTGSDELDDFGWHQNTRDARSSSGHIPIAHTTRPAPLRDADGYSAPQIPIEYMLFDPQGDQVKSITAEFSLNGGGDWREASLVQEGTPEKLDTLIRVEENDPQSIAGSPSADSTLRFADAGGNTNRVNHLEVNLEIDYPANSNLSATLSADWPAGQNTSVELFNNLTSTQAMSAQITLSDTAVEILEDGQPLRSGVYRLAQGSSLGVFRDAPPETQFTLTIENEAPNPVTLNKWSLSTGVMHELQWDTVNSDFYGQSDNVVFRIKAIPAPPKRSGIAAGPYQRGSYATETPPFRARGIQVQVLDPNGDPVKDARVFRKEKDKPWPAKPIENAQTEDYFYTNEQGYLEGKGKISLEDDKLIALAPITQTETYGFYYTNLTFDENGEPITEGTERTERTEKSIRRIKVSAEYPLLLFNLDVALEWDARKDTAFQERLMFDLKRTSAALYDWSNAQIALGEMRVYQDLDSWEEASIRIFASNRVRPNADQGGIVRNIEPFDEDECKEQDDGTLLCPIANDNELVCERQDDGQLHCTDPYGSKMTCDFSDEDKPVCLSKYNDNDVQNDAQCKTENWVTRCDDPSPDAPNVTYKQGQVRMGAVWNRYGDAASDIGEDWPRSLAHELSHYALFLDDNYMGLDEAGLLTTLDRDSCPGAMSGPYLDDNTEFHPETGWATGVCTKTLSHQATGRSDWETIATFYPGLKQPLDQTFKDLPKGPFMVPLELTEVTFPPPRTEPTDLLDDTIFSLVNADGSSLQLDSTARAFLFDKYEGTSDYVTDLGSPVLDQVNARGAAVGDTLCVYAMEDNLLGCKEIEAGDNQQLEVFHESELQTLCVDDSDKSIVDCEVIHPEEKQQLVVFEEAELRSGAQQQWQPDVIIKPETAGKITVSVTGVGNTSERNLKAVLFPENNPATDDDKEGDDEICMNGDKNPSPTYSEDLTLEDGIYSAEFDLCEPAVAGKVYIFDEESRDPERGNVPQLSVVASYALGGNPDHQFVQRGKRKVGRRTYSQRRRSNGSRRSSGRRRSRRAPAVSPDGQVILFGENLKFDDGTFYALQPATIIPPVPSWTNRIGHAYRLLASDDAPSLGGPDTPSDKPVSISFAYLGSEVPPGEEEFLAIYYKGPTNDDWVKLETTDTSRDTNMISAQAQGEGIYVLLSTTAIPLESPWDAFGYPVPDHDPRPIVPALASLEDVTQIDEENQCVQRHYTSVWHRDPDVEDQEQEEWDAWRGYHPDAPWWVSDLNELEFGEDYHINPSKDTMLYVNGIPGEYSDEERAEEPLPRCETVARSSTQAHAADSAQVPAAYYGTISGGNADEEIKAYINDELCGKGTTFTITDDDGNDQVVYAQTVIAARCGARPGDLVTFEVNGQKMAPMQGWGNAEANEVNLVPAPTIEIDMPDDGLVVNEGEQIGVTLTLSEAIDHPVTVRYLPDDGMTVRAGETEAESDDQTITFTPLTTKQTIIISTDENENVEPSRQMQLKLYDAVNAILDTDSVTITIEDDDTRPLIFQFDQEDLSVSEGQTTVPIGVTAPGTLTEPVTMRVESMDGDGTATAHEDYAPVREALTFSADHRSQTITLTIIDDAIIEADETLSLQLINPVSPTLEATTQMTVIIKDNDLPFIEFGAAETSIPVSTSAIVTVTLSQTPTTAINVECVSGHGDVLASGETIPSSTQVEFQPGQQISECTIPLENKQLRAGESMLLFLRKPSGAHLGEQDTMVVRIESYQLYLPVITTAQATTHDGTE